MQKKSLQLYNGKFINIIATQFLTCAKNMHVHYYLIHTDLMHQPTMHLKISCIHETMHQPKHPQYRYTHSCPCHEPRLKMAKNTCRQKIFLQVIIRWGSMHPASQAFFLLGDGEGVGFICSQCVLMTFSLCSHKFSFSLRSQHAPQAPNVFPPNMFPISPHFISHLLP